MLLAMVGTGSKPSHHAFGNGWIWLQAHSLTMLLAMVGIGSKPSHHAFGNGIGSKPSHHAIGND
jgi:hypothetical protein